jgi:hypothetical protein
MGGLGACARAPLKRMLLMHRTAPRMHAGGAWHSAAACMHACARAWARGGARAGAAPAAAGQLACRRRRCGPRAGAQQRGAPPHAHEA